MTVQADVKTVTLTIDDNEVTVPQGTLVIRAAEQIGIAIPRFCDHPLLDPVGACRQCLVEVPDAGNGRPLPKPQASCTLPAAAGMVVRTQLSSAVADKAQHGVMELLLINHPLDCPVCDKGGECPLQNQAMSNGREETRFEGVKRTFPKPINISAEVLLDRERCVLCARCTRFSEQIAGDPFISLLERGALQQVGIYEKEPFESYFSGNTIQICPVGALTSAAYRFRARPFDLVSTPTICEHCADGCALRTDHRRGKITRRLAINDPDVNEEWNCDKGRFAFTSQRQSDRLLRPMVRDDDTGELRIASWPEAFIVAAGGLSAAGAAVGVLTGGRLPTEDAYGYGKFARAVLGTNDIDFRARPLSDEEADFIAAHVVLSNGPTYADLEQASVVVLAGLEPEEESPIVFLRLRKAHRKRGVRVYSVAAHASRGLVKMGGRLLSTVPGDEAAAITAVAENGDVALDGGGIILAGERLASVAGALSAVADLANRTGAKVAWVPRRAGERGAVEMGVLPQLLPGGRPFADASARVDVAAAWGVDALPEPAGRNGDEILAAAADGALSALLVGGVDVNDLSDPAAALEALDKVGFLVSLEVRESEVTKRADVVLPVSAMAERDGIFVNWEGRVRPFDAVFDDTVALRDLRVLAGIADEMGKPLGFKTSAGVRKEATELGPWDGDRAVFAPVEAPGASERGPARDDAAKNDQVEDGHAQARVATWRMLVDDARAIDGEPYLAATARRPVAALSAALAETIDVSEGDYVEVTGESGAATWPVVIAEVADGTVWLPSSAQGVHLRRDLGVGHGSTVQIAKGRQALVLEEGDSVESRSEREAAS
jgi:NADH-quinone oxidoreductase subunit G